MIQQMRLSVVVAALGTFPISGPITPFTRRNGPYEILRKSQENHRDSPGTIPGQSNEIIVYVFSCLLFIFLWCLCRFPRAIDTFKLLTYPPLRTLTNTDNFYASILPFPPPPLPLPRQSSSAKSPPPGTSELPREKGSDQLGEAASLLCEASWGLLTL